MKLKDLYPLVIGLTMIVRIIWALAVPVMSMSDSVAYDIFSQNLAHGRGSSWDGVSPTAYWTYAFTS